jgi:hypothetical protein
MNRDDFRERGRLLRKAGHPKPRPVRITPGIRYEWRRAALIEGWIDEDEFLQRVALSEQGKSA